ncbi:MFS transporter [Novosphingobium mangrovi (ex Hu et al. 2023)]|uniref:MFS transporter n=1 Tax=Novosphingobium mangrovi (ex Hu et al. 2023) TaxID=2930094 RepID=A0ABT0AGY5_9SPHN|nr:MFS transporter [Novosphingobium mangrovi (ex Hu et al. 2023)]MCJ1962447.1 MFS transporter [Novosphingobium mangrovi (ex Hu et al. 2023)]
MSPALRIGAVGFGLIAICYGLARFAFGLFLPQIDADLGLGSSLAGIISGGSFAGYCIAILVSAALTQRFGARAVATLAALVAGIGMAGIALAPNPILLAVSVLVAGASTGLASPPMAAAVVAAVREERQDATNTTINAGTSVGVAVSGPIALAMAGQWRLAFGAFAVLAFALGVSAASLLPQTPTQSRWPRTLPRFDRAMLHLIAATFLTGAASTALWSFGSQLVAQRLTWGAAASAALWSVIGAGGIVGAMAGKLVARSGLENVHTTFLAVMALSIFAVGSELVPAPVALAGGGLFGAAYVTLTGVYLIWGVRLLPDRPATGLTIAFLMLAVGQTAGAPLFGWLLAALGSNASTAVFAGIAILAASLGKFHRLLPASRKTQHVSCPVAGP